MWSSEGLFVCEWVYGGLGGSICVKEGLVWSSEGLFV